MKFRMLIECDNAAFEQDHQGEIGRIIRELAEKLESTSYNVVGGQLRDINGNNVGHWSIEQ